MAETAQVLPLLRPEEGVRRVAVLGAFRVADGRGDDLTPKGRKTRRYWPICCFRRRG